jgi:hypothetical protein
MRTGSGIFGGWSVGSSTASAGTAFSQLIPPDSCTIDPNGGCSVFPIGGPVSGSMNPNLLSTVRRAGWFGSQGSPAIGALHLTDLVYSTGNTAHAIALLQPLNWTYTTATSAQNTTTITLAYDPGKYSTAFAYGNGAFQASVADNLIANTDYVATQLADGTWFSSKVSAFNTTTLVLTLVTATPATTTNTAGGILINTPVFFFGQASDVNPATGSAHWATTTVVNTTRQAIIGRDTMGGFTALRAGDPVLFLSPNTTGAGSLDYAAGAFWKY